MEKLDIEPLSSNMESKRTTTDINIKDARRLNIVVPIIEFFHLCSCLRHIEKNYEIQKLQ